MKANPDKTIHDFLLENNVNISLSYSNMDFHEDLILDIIKNDQSMFQISRIP